MHTNIIAYLFTAFIFFAMDFVWLSLSGARIYRARLGELMLKKPRLGVAAVFYLLYIFAAIIFVVAPALQAESWSLALGSGALFGVVAYGTYDLTNLATLAGWSAEIALIDMAWGTFLTATAATGGYFLTRLFM